MSIGSFFKKAGTDLEKVLGIVIKAAGASEPVVDAFFPGFAPLFNAGVAEAAKVFAMAQAAGEQGGSASDQVAAIAAAVEPSVTAYAVSLGQKQATADQVNAWTNAILASLQAFAQIAPVAPVSSVPAAQTQSTVTDLAPATPAAGAASDVQTGPGLHTITT